MPLSARSDGPRHQWCDRHPNQLSIVSTVELPWPDLYRIRLRDASAGQSLCSELGSFGSEPAWSEKCSAIKSRTCVPAPHRIFPLRFKIKEKTRYKPLAAGVYYEAVRLLARASGWREQ